MKIVHFVPRYTTTQCDLEATKNGEKGLFMYKLWKKTEKHG